MPKAKYKEPYRIEGGVTDRILKQFEKRGDDGGLPRLTVEQIMALAGFTDRNSLQARLRKLSKPTERTPQKLRIVDFVFEFGDLKRYPRPIYELGTGRNKTLPGWRTRNAQQCRERRERKAEQRLSQNAGTASP